MGPDEDAPRSPFTCVYDEAVTLANIDPLLLSLYAAMGPPNAATVCAVHSPGERLPVKVDALPAFYQPPPNAEDVAALARLRFWHPRQRAHRFSQVSGECFVQSR